MHDLGPPNREGPKTNCPPPGCLSFRKQADGHRAEGWLKQGS